MRVSAHVLAQWPVLLTKTVLGRSRRRSRGRQSGGEKTISNLLDFFSFIFATKCSHNVRETEVAASFSRGFGIGVAIFVATACVWLRLQDDAARVRQVRHDVAQMKQTYREQAAILTCWENASLFDTDRPKPVIRMIVSPAQFRDRQLDLAFVDQTVERDQCKIDTNPQNIDIALHEAGQTRALAILGSTQRFAAQTQ